MPVVNIPMTILGLSGYGLFRHTSRYGTPADFKYLVDTLHLAELSDYRLGAAHFPRDDFAY